jgi:hypothetical protein
MNDLTFTEEILFKLRFTEGLEGGHAVDPERKNPEKIRKMVKARVLELA